MEEAVGALKQVVGSNTARVLANATKIFEGEAFRDFAEVSLVPSLRQKLKEEGHHGDFKA